jgi:hypothetical protein
MIEGIQGIHHPWGGWLPLGISCMAVGFACLVILMVALIRSRKRPTLHINSGTGHEYQVTTPPEEGIQNAMATFNAGFRVAQMHTLRLRVKETSNVPAKNVAVRITAAYPAPEEGEFSFPCYLQFHEHQVEKIRNFGPGDRDYVGLLHVVEMEDGRMALTPPFLFKNDPVVLELEVLEDGKRADIRHFSISGHTAVAPDGHRIVSNQAPLVTEVPILNADA